MERCEGTPPHENPNYHWLCGTFGWSWWTCFHSIQFFFLRILSMYQPNFPRNINYSTYSTCGCRSPHKSCVFHWWSKVVSFHLYSTKPTLSGQEFVFIIAICRSVQLLCFERQTIVFVVLVAVSYNRQVGKGCA